MHALAAALFGLSVKGAVLAVTVGLLSVLLGRKMPPTFRRALWCLVVVRLLLPLAPPSPLALLGVDGGRSGGALLRGLDELVPGSGATAPPPAATAHRTDLGAAAGFLWILGVAAFAVHDGLTRRRLRRLLSRARPITAPRALELLARARHRLGLRRPVSLFETSALDGPAVAGVLVPRIYLPTGLVDDLTDGELGCVLLHELAHLKRGDAVVQALARLATAVHWFNPAAQWAARRLLADCELACDADVLARLDAEERPAYGQTLIRLLTRPPAPRALPGLVALGLGTRREIKRRIEMIARYRPTPRTHALALAALVAVLATVGLTDPPAVADKAAPAAGTDDETTQLAQKQTIDLTRLIGTAMYAWLKEAREASPGGAKAGTPSAPTTFDWKKCPAITYADLKTLLVPRYTEYLPANDGWGHPFELCLDRANPWATDHVIGVRSAGAGGRFEGSSYPVAAFPPAEAQHDIVWIDGYFVAWPGRR